MRIWILSFAWLVQIAACGLAAEPAHDFTQDQDHPHVEATRHTPEPQHGRVCFSSSESREKISSRRLSEPFGLLRGATGRAQGEPLRAKLCRWNDDYVYEIALLRRDGRIVHVYLNAANGQPVGPYVER